MRYFGGKARVAAKIANFINGARGEDQPYWEPFVGGGWILSRVHGKPNYASDKHCALIAMWDSLTRGWRPPTCVTAEDYYAAKDLPDSDPRKAFIGFGCSFAGKWFGGYAKSGSRNYAMNAANSLDKKMRSMRETSFFCADFLTDAPPEQGMLIYCDPPYKGTTGYATGDFDVDAFWKKCKSLSDSGHAVFVSEYTAPAGFECVLEVKTHTDIRNSMEEQEARVERLFTVI